MPAAGFAALMGQALGVNAAASAGSSAGAGIADALFGGISARRNWKYKQKEMALQQQYALEQMSKSAEFQLAHDKQMFDYQNAYNDPSAVLERNLAAGLNPAAVLGQSGVGVSATIPTASGGAPSGHGPVASGSGGGLAALAGNPSAYADIQLKDAQQERERSAAALNDAEAEWYKSQTVDKDLRERLMKAQAGLAEQGITESSSRAKLNTAISLSYSIDNELKEAAFGYNLELIKANLGKAKEEYYQLKTLTGYVDDLLEGELQLLTARAIYLKSSSSNQEQLTRVNELTADDLENWFDVNWNTQIEVPIINEKGKVERTVKMTGKEIRREYMKLNLQDFQYDMYANRWEIEKDLEGVCAGVEQKLGWPVFVKPANAGSSVGISKVSNREELKKAIALALENDRKVVFEAFVDGQEVECAVIGSDPAVATRPGEILAGAEFYTYDDKYKNGVSQTVIPAHLPEEKLDEVKTYAAMAYTALGCEGLARCDFFVEKGTGRVMINEINTFPGFTAISMYPKLMEHEGLPVPALIDRLIELALERTEKQHG